MVLGKLGLPYFGGRGGWVAEVDLVANGAAETAAGDGFGGRHGRGIGVEYLDMMFDEELRELLTFCTADN